MGQRFYEQQWEIHSFTDPDKVYKVSLRTDGGWECSCPSWIFGRKRHEAGWVCKHITHVQANMQRFRREEVVQARQEGRRVTVQTDEYDIELIESGRIKGFIDSL